MAIDEIGKVLRHIQVAFEFGTVTGLTDRQLVERFAAHRDSDAEVAFAALVQRHGPMVMRVCRSILRNHQDAQDAFQTTFLILAQKAGSLWVRDSVGPWLHGVACRVAACSRAAAARRRFHERRAAVMTTHSSGARDDGHDDMNALVHECLARLPERYRVPIVLCDLEGQTYEAVARLRGCPVGTVKSRLARGRERLRNMLERRGASPVLEVLAGACRGAKTLPSLTSTLVDETTQLATGYAMGHAPFKVVSATISQLTDGALKMMFLSKLKVAAAFLAIGCGLFSISVLCFGHGSNANGPGAAEDGTEANRQEPAPISASTLRSTPSEGKPGALSDEPKPWETAVRMRIHGKESVSFGSGTIVESTPEKSIVFTAAHYFKVDGFEQFVPSKFPYKIEIDLFDGKLADSNPAQVHFLETIAGELMDYDFDRDVALVQVRPGRRLAASRVVPSSWEPRVGMQVLTVGCSEGNDATAWHTKITNPSTHRLAGKPDYEAIECMTAPKQGRSGGGLFTDDGFLAGVCNYADPRTDRGLYAPPSSIYVLLARNGFAVEDRRLDDQIRALEEMIDRETMKLRVWKEQRRIAAGNRRSRGSDPSPGPVEGPKVEGVVSDPGPIQQLVQRPEHEGRLRDVEQKLDRILKLLEGRKSELKSPR